MFHGGVVLVGGVSGRIGRSHFRQVTESVGIGNLAVTFEPERFVQAEFLCGFGRRHRLLPVFEGDVLDKGTDLQRVGHFAELGIGGVQARLAVTAGNGGNGLPAVVLLSIAITVCRSMIDTPSGGRQAGAEFSQK